ncbi:MAG: DUF1674 domain-containing protein [Alphaproteobacteria bacterium]|jgi:hypothetical protein|nr:DUF1674 domain-containing protein [Rhodospirillaceae bacterium]MDG2482930.1 DUF1674 domain-containing protein [Alphaproteobacteria bacterium]MBT6203142.1 DUF1674 domain-containing protein [Rhodospirillaceae bacterium]MBT6511465.1 DUF1674 domain-containing protein [Rhodospirillaceae bacterium]MBT7614871.1 DUF1674 domain-containing protein [Rhodospirillaceae bacterium]
MSDETGKEDETVDKTPKTGPDGKPMPEEVGGPKGPEPTRYGDWEVNGRVSDF